MFPTVIYLILFLAIPQYAVEAKVKCKQYEILDKNCTNNCQKRCGDPDNRPCDLTCTPKEKCVCKKGYVRNNKGKCIKESKCSPKECPKNMEFLKVTETCVRTCENPEPSGCRPNSRKPGCSCKEGYVFNKHGHCILLKDCPVTTTPAPVTCPPNMYPTKCGSRCPPKCSDKDPWNKICNRACSISPCECKYPYALDSNGTCVHFTQCPGYTTTTQLPEPICPENMVPTDCGSRCPPKCSDEDPWFKPCKSSCSLNRCECKFPFALDDKGNCIYYPDCPDKPTTPTPPVQILCPENTVFTECGSACPPKCSEPEDVLKPCPLSCKVNICECRAPFAWNDQGECVRREQCPSTTPVLPPSEKVCPKNMVWTDCKSKCVNRCGEKPPQFCKLSCDGEGCQCPHPFYLTPDGKCVRKRHCKKYLPKCEDPLMKWSSCPPKQNVTCYNMNDKQEEGCGEPGCTCRQGMVYHKGLCYDKSDCKLLNKLDKLQLTLQYYQDTMPGAQN
uniref:TIL domain-containing protein n=1 Tax=Parastrongyloides trichosuri TaxID=131310 RepID=A0A0N5A6N4_PARTI